MTTENPNEGKPVEPKVEVPTPTFEETKAQPLGGDLKTLQTSLETFQAEIRGQLKALQSDKDKRIPKLEGSLQELMSEITRLKGHGFTDEEAVNEVEFRQNVKELAQKIRGIEQSALPTGTGISGAAQEAAEIVKEFQLDTSDPEVLALLGGKYRGYDHLRAEAALLVARKATKPTPSSASSPPLPGGTIKTPGEKELVAEYTKEMLAARGKRDVLKAIQAKYREKGLDTGKVTFTV